MTILYTKLVGIEAVGIEAAPWQKDAILDLVRFTGRLRKKQDQFYINQTLNSLVLVKNIHL